ncbi:hypothetical protein CsSME_00041043 [Camellia sinensis var. sinensis]
MEKLVLSPPHSQSPPPPHKSMNNTPRRSLTTTSIHIMALDSIVNVNSLFTLAVFLGLALNPSDPNYTLIPTTACAASSAVGEHLVAFHVYSFSSFLFSSLIASALKQAIRTAKDDDDGGDVVVVGGGGVEMAHHVNLKMLRAGILASAAGSASGCVFLTLALVDLVQIKLGSLACWSWYSLAAIAPLDQQVTVFAFRYSCYILLVLSAFSSISFLYWSHCSGPCYSSVQTAEQKQNQPINLLSFPSAWNRLSFPLEPPSNLLKIALFVKKWPHRFQAGGLERHALTLHLTLAKRGHELHIFTASSPNTSFPKYPISNLHFHQSKPTNAGYLDQAIAWRQFQAQNSTGKPFDVIHTESVGLLHTRSRGLPNLAVTWHGIAYEAMHTDIIQELLRTPEEHRAYALTERATKVVDEVKFFQNYAHHVATSNHAGDVLKRIYMIPEERVHIILNGVDEEIFKPDVTKGKDFKQKFGIPQSKSLIFGMAGRLVKDKGHPLMFEALKQIFTENSRFRESVVVLVAGDGPWSTRYKDLGANLLVLGPLEQAQLAGFYNAIDVFVNPTLRAQGLDHTLLEAILTGKPVMATRLASITGSVIVGPEMGYTFSPTIDSLKKVLYQVWEDGRGNLEMKGQASRERGLKLFAATKMATAYERLFLCISYNGESSYDYCTYHPPNA